ncbi:hybrid sensor histidine kinase/response regulator, partial [Bacillus anthracis]
ELFYTDEKRLQQIIKNMLSNALKFTEQGSVMMQVEQMQKEQMTVEMEKKSDTWLIMTYQDTGIGISEEQQELIFDAFHQADGAIVRKYGGTGLGLSISKELVTLLGGWITVHSIQGKGSTFTVYIPSIPKGIAMLEKHAEQITYEEVAASQNTEQAGDVPTAPGGYQESMLFQGKRMLIVDDDHRNRFALQSALEKQGITVISAEDGVACLDILEKNTAIDLVLMDIMMPHM